MRNRLDSRQASAEATAAAIAAAGSAEAPGGADTRPGNKLLWHAYAAPPDAIGWLDSVIGSVETMRICVAISDMRIAGNPLIYVNQAFCQVTGYTKAEVHGRNCRFLQGPESQVASVAQIIEAQRQGADVVVKITNYKRSGETFDNLLSLRSVHDTNGVYRFCIAVQMDASAGTGELELLKALLQLLPRFLCLSPETPPIGPIHSREETVVEAQKQVCRLSWYTRISLFASDRHIPCPRICHACSSRCNLSQADLGADTRIDEMIAQALEATERASTGAPDLHGPVRFAHHYAQMKGSTVQVPDRVPLIKVLWLDLGLARSLEEAFKDPSIASELNELVPSLEKSIGTKGEPHPLHLETPPAHNAIWTWARCR